MSRYFVVYAYKFCSVELKRREPRRVVFNRPQASFGHVAYLFADDSPISAAKIDSGCR